MGNVVQWLASVRIAMLVASLGVSTTATGTLLSTLDPRIGTDAATLDTGSRRVWLDLSITSGRSYDEITAQLSRGGLYDGYRFAAPDEVEELFEHAGIPDIDDYTTLNRGTTGNVDPVRALIALMGPSNAFQTSGITLSELIGFTSQHVLMNGFDLIQIAHVTVRDDVPISGGTQSFAEAFTASSFLFPSTAYVGVGGWLVREIPEPSILTCILIAALGFARTACRGRNSARSVAPKSNGDLYGDQYRSGEPEWLSGTA